MPSSTQMSLLDLSHSLSDENPGLRFLLSLRTIWLSALWFAFSAAKSLGRSTFCKCLERLRLIIPSGVTALPVLEVNKSFHLSDIGTNQLPH